MTGSENPYSCHFDTILFDLGSTLIYFDGDWQNVIDVSIVALTQALEIQGSHIDKEQFFKAFNERLHAYYIERDREYIEYTTESVLVSLLRDLNYPYLPKEKVRTALDAMYQVTEQHWYPEPEALPTLEILKNRGYRLGLISNAGDAQDVYNLLEKANLRSFFELILVSADAGIRKPNPRIFKMALDHFSVPPSRAVMVGDNLNADILGARKSGIASIWITKWAANPGSHVFEDAIIPDSTVSNLRELPDLINHWKI
jgi:HAD superfamily hydrolase (TIGR01662 family)